MSWLLFLYSSNKMRMIVVKFLADELTEASFEEEIPLLFDELPDTVEELKLALEQKCP